MSTETAIDRLRSTARLLRTSKLDTSIADTIDAALFLWNEEKARADAAADHHHRLSLVCGVLDIDPDALPDNIALVNDARAQVDALREDADLARKDRDVWQDKWAALLLKVKAAETRADQATARAERAETEAEVARGMQGMAEIERDEARELLARMTKERDAASARADAAGDWLDKANRYAIERNEAQARADRLQTDVDEATAALDEVDQDTGDPLGHRVRKLVSLSKYLRKESTEARCARNDERERADALYAGVERVRAFVEEARSTVEAANTAALRATADGIDVVIEERAAAQASYRMALDCLAALTSEPGAAPQTSGTADAATDGGRESVSGSAPSASRVAAKAPPASRGADGPTEPRTFWSAAEESARAAKAGPAWMRAGIRLNPEHFVTYPPEPPTTGGTDGPRDRRADEPARASGGGAAMAQEAGEAPSAQAVEARPRVQHAAEVAWVQPLTQSDELRRAVAAWRERDRLDTCARVVAAAAALVDTPPAAPPADAPAPEAPSSIDGWARLLADAWEQAHGVPPPQPWSDTDEAVRDCYRAQARAALAAFRAAMTSDVALGAIRAASATKGVRESMLAALDAALGEGPVVADVQPRKWSFWYGLRGEVVDCVSANDLKVLHNMSSDLEFRTRQRNEAEAALAAERKAHEETRVMGDKGVAAWQASADKYRAERDEARRQLTNSHRLLDAVGQEKTAAEERARKAEAALELATTESRHEAERQAVLLGEVRFMRSQRDALAAAVRAHIAWMDAPEPNRTVPVVTIRDVERALSSLADAPAAPADPPRPVPPCPVGETRLLDWRERKAVYDHVEMVDSRQTLAWLVDTVRALAARK